MDGLNASVHKKKIDIPGQSGQKAYKLNVRFIYALS